MSAETAIAILISVPVGILCSFAAWWILFHYFSPSLAFSNSISRLPAIDSKSGYKYRFKILNTGKRSIIDLQLRVRLRIRSIDPELPNNTKLIDLPLGTDSIPRLDSGKSRVFRIYPERCDRFATALFPEDIVSKSKSSSLTLDDAISIMDNSFITIVVFGYDSFSGARKMFESNPYLIRDIATGKFEGLGIAQEVESA